jgi:hypothetical protein
LDFLSVETIRFQGEASELQMLYLSTGAGAFKFLGDTVGSLFPVPRLVDDQKSAQIYDYVKLSECTPIHAQSLDTALEYEIFLDYYPKHLDRVSWVEDKMELASFSDNEKRALLQAMRENRRLSVDDPPRSGIRKSREGALEVIDRIKTGVPAPLADFIDTYSADRDRAIDTNSYRALLAQFGDTAYRRAQSDNFIYRMFSDQRRTSLPQNVTIESIQDWAEGGRAPTAFAAMSAQDAAMCAVKRWDAAAHYMFDRIPDAVERLNAAVRGRRDLGMEPADDAYCTDVGFRKTKIVCLGETAFKIAYFSCLTNKPIGQPGSLVNRLTLRPRR